jgi:ribonuclease BN (tRNA processing enzyme)
MSSYKKNIDVDLFEIIKKDKGFIPRLLAKKKQQEALVRWRHDVQKQIESDNYRLERDRLIGNLTRNIVGPHTVKELLNRPKKFKELFTNHHDKAIADRIIELDTKIRSHNEYMEEREKRKPY